MAFGPINVSGISDIQTNTNTELIARVASLEKALLGLAKIPGSGDPTPETPGEVGQIYINTSTGQEFKCIEVNDQGRVWEPRTDLKINLEVYSAGTTPPADTKLLWIDTKPSNPGLKYWNGSAWVNVPVYGF